MKGLGWAKLILFGEHAAVHGYPALGVSLPLETQVFFDPAAAWDFQGVQESHREKLHQVLEALDRWKPLKPGIVKIHSSVPESSGFGSSGALCIALVRALYPGLTDEEIWQGANEGEKIFHGRPSGIDTGLALGQGLMGFIQSPGSLPKKSQYAGWDFHFVTGSVPRTGSTRSLVEALNRRLATEDPLAVTGIRKLGSLAEKAVALAQTSGNNNPRLLGAMAQEAQGTLGQLGLSHPSLDKIFHWAGNHGALGGKVSGAGGGGAFFLLMPTGDEAKNLAGLLRTFVKTQEIPISSPIFAFTWNTQRVILLKE